ncbi:proteoglycan 4 [Nematostella vectensis]|uniref:proteoglycan 4 n=1 Tax=Nematostella vectensis TaxID=45351 RepID=UPI0020772C13|nr:proteoglycan 4 [Nematostella vectensis]
MHRSHTVIFTALVLSIIGILFTKASPISKIIKHPKKSDWGHAKRDGLNAIEDDKMNEPAVQDTAGLKDEEANGVKVKEEKQDRFRNIAADSGDTSQAVQAKEKNDNEVKIQDEVEAREAGSINSDNFVKDTAKRPFEEKIYNDDGENLELEAPKSKAVKESDDRNTNQIEEDSTKLPESDTENATLHKEKNTKEVKNKPTTNEVPTTYEIPTESPTIESTEGVSENEDFEAAAMVRTTGKPTATEKQPEGTEIFPTTLDMTSNTPMTTLEERSTPVRHERTTEKTRPEPTEYQKEVAEDDIDDMKAEKRSDVEEDEKKIVDVEEGNRGGSVLEPKTKPTEATRPKPTEGVQPQPTEQGMVEDEKKVVEVEGGKGGGPLPDHKTEPTGRTRPKPTEPEAGVAQDDIDDMKAAKRSGIVEDEKKVVDVEKGNRGGSLLEPKTEPTEATRPKHSEGVHPQPTKQGVAEDENENLKVAVSGKIVDVEEGNEGNKELVVPKSRTEELVHTTHEPTAPIETVTTTIKEHRLRTEEKTHLKSTTSPGQEHSTTSSVQVLITLITSPVKEASALNTPSDQEPTVSTSEENQPTETPDTTSMPQHPSAKPPPTPHGEEPEAIESLKSLDELELSYLKMKAQARKHRMTEEDELDKILG